jgi:hypothetical protein
MATCGRNNVEMHKLADRGLNAVQIGAQLGVSRMTVARRLAEALVCTRPTAGGILICLTQRLNWVNAHIQQNSTASRHCVARTDFRVCRLPHGQSSVSRL